MPLPEKHKDLPKPQAVMDAYDRAMREWGEENNRLLPHVTIRQRACKILYGDDA